MGKSIHCNRRDELIKESTARCLRKFERAVNTIFNNRKRKDFNDEILLGRTLRDVLGPELRIPAKYRKLKNQ